METERKKAKRLTGWLLLLLAATGIWFSLPSSLRSELEPKAHASDFIVTNANDAGPGSLRAAIINANLNPSQPSYTQNFVVFSIPGSGEVSIHLLSPLPAVTSPLWINGANNALRVELDGSDAGPAANGITVMSQHCAVYNLLINRFSGAGIAIIGGGSTTLGNNRLGTNRAVTLNLPNARGIEITNSNGNGISGNFITGNGGAGIELHDSANNYIYSNVITGNTLSGVFIGGPLSKTNTVAGNQIGVRDSIANGNQNGVSVDTDASANTISSNTIAGNSGEGILIEGHDNVIQNNQVGSSTNNQAVITGNGHDGILIRNGAGNLIGGKFSGQGNFLVWNAANGIEITGAGASGNKIINNNIGIDGSRTTSFSNGMDGIRISSGAHGNTVGDGGDNWRNQIAFNAGAGVRVTIDAGSGNTIWNNAIHDNGGLGIDLGPAGITPNDFADTDSGANDLQNFPLLAAARSSTGGTYFTFNRGYVEGNLNSIPNSTFRLDFYANASCDASGNGEGASFLGSTQVRTAPDGNASFAAGDLPFLPGAFITAVATDAGGSTSEFSPCTGTQNAGTLIFDGDDRLHYAAASESAGSVTLTVLRDGGTAGNVIIDYATSNGTAAAGSDFVTTTGTLSFADGETSKTLTIPLINDNLAEGPETFSVSLSNPTGGAGYGYLPLTVVIDDDELPGRKIYSVSSPNQLSGFNAARANVTLSSVPLTGSETILKIDFRPATGRLYGIGEGGHLFIIDKNTGAMTQVGTAPIPNFSQSPVGFDFDPVTDRIRLLLADGRNLQINPDTGAVSSTDGMLAFAPTDANAGLTPNIYELAYSNNLAGATLTTAYATNEAGYSAMALLTLGSTNGSPVSPNTGQLFTVGGYGGVTFYGLDIAGEQAYTIGVNIEDNVTLGAPGLFKIDLATQFATRIGNPETLPRDIAIEPLQQLQFSSARYSVNENAGAATITVKRYGGTSGSVSVNYATSDMTATAGSDYTAVNGTLTFADGETSTTFTVPLLDDTLIEGVEGINLTLSNAPAGFVIGPRNPATIAMMDEPADAGANPIDNADFFVRQHYADFLNRQPDASGLTFWTNHVTQCFNDPVCTNDRRVGTSAAFFIENEFQQTGFFIYRFYQVAFARRPTYAEFTADRGQVVGGANLENGKQAFATDFVQRPAFVQQYPLTMDGPAFVDAVINTANQALGVVDLSSRRAALIFQYNAGTNQRDSRVKVMRALADDGSVSAVLYNPAFVLMQYFGYLRRPPDQAGYNFWLNHLNNRNPNNYRAMVCAFITSSEYQRRFSSTITRSDQDCPH
jgi:parallel beta-helix repeat protein